MSPNIAFATRQDKAAAELARRNADSGGKMPADIEEAVAAIADAMPPTNMVGYNTLNVAAYGHVRGEGEPTGASSITVQVQWVLDVTASPDV